MKAKLSKLSIDFQGDENIKTHSQIASGRHSCVYSTNHPEYVVKFVNLEDHDLITYNKSENYAYLHLDKHPHICRTFLYKENRIYKDKLFGCYLMENCSNGSLADTLNSIQKSFSESLILEILYQISLGLSQLHSLDPPIQYRSLMLEKILIGMDGKLKICDFGHIFFARKCEFNDSTRKNLQKEIEEIIDEKYRAPELCDLSSNLPITTASDVWALGCILYWICYKKFPFEGKIAIINNHYVIPKQPVYSEKILTIFKRIFVANPLERANISEILQLIQKDYAGNPALGSFSFSKNVMQSKKNENLYSNQPVNVEKKEKQVKPKFMDLMNKHFKRLTTKSEGWLLSALEENEEGPQQKFVRFLIIKAWNKNEKIIKFYKFLQKHVTKNMDNCVIILKSLIVLHNYFKKGPPDCFKLKNSEGNPSTILTNINEFWKKVTENKQKTSKDKKRTPYISTLILQFCRILLRKMQIQMKYCNFFEGNFAMTPFFKNLKAMPVTLSLIEELLAFLSDLNEFNQCVLNEKALWRIQISLVLSMIDEEYCLISVLVHLIHTLRKASNFINAKINEEKLKHAINSLTEKFEKTFMSIRNFFVNCKNIKELQKEQGKEQENVIPDMKLEVIDYLKSVKILEKNLSMKSYNIFTDLNTNKNICEFVLPICYGQAIKDLRIDEMIGTEEVYKTSTGPINRKTVGHSPDFKPLPGQEISSNYDFTQFLATKNSIEEDFFDKKKKSFSMSGKPNDNNQHNNNLIENQVEENKEKMVYLGFKKGDSVITTTNEDFTFESVKPLNENVKTLNENLLEIIKKDEETPGLYSEFSHQQLNKSIFEISKEQEIKQPHSSEKHEKGLNNPATTMERDYDVMYSDVDPENIINFDNFTKYLNEQKQSAPENKAEVVWETFDLGNSEQESIKEENPLNVKASVSNNIEKKENIEIKQQKPLEHTFTQDFLNNLEANKVQPQKSQHLELVEEVDFVMVKSETDLHLKSVEGEAKKAEENKEEKNETPVKIDQKNEVSPSKTFTEAKSENIQSDQKQESLKEQEEEDEKDEKDDPIRQLLGDDDINISDYILEYSQLKFGNQIGAGSTSVVYLGHLKDEAVAIKKIKVAEIDESNIIEFKREISALVRLKSHPNLVAFKGVSYSETNVCIVTEFCHGGTLFDLLHRKRNIQLSWEQRIKFALDVAKGVLYLHTTTPPIIHRDLKSLKFRSS